jgi:hypothetical protein
MSAPPSLVHTNMHPFDRLSYNCHYVILYIRVLGSPYFLHYSVHPYVLYIYINSLHMYSTYVVFLVLSNFYFYVCALHSGLADFRALHIR